ncbi:KpsF/GutQ family sugar-phosphate isomerase [Pseudomonas kilonensis]|uniref:KpsF/GutQ family sugar-phosphate isomerase n=1 Tax=Pseudomonas kilonensis TaxID=132476 RepID=UPI000463847D|nr:KpsF/GutQ family sugar-phosphate isomerase [Pseudomonas kilonensis]
MNDKLLSEMGSDRHLLTLGREVLISEGRALIKLSNELEDNGFVDVVRLILACKGHVVILGVGKSGHVGKKIAASLASTGTPSFFIHPSEAKHGDLGMITAHDLAVLISYSGRSEEILSLLPYLHDLGVNTVALTNFSSSELACKTNAHVALKVDREACPYNLAPTVSSSATLGVGDAIAMALMRIKRFTKEAFSKNHPAGNLGKVLTVKIRDVMVRGDKVPALPPGTLFLEAVSYMANKRLGFVVVVDTFSRPLGVFTDGDMARVLRGNDDIAYLKISDVMEINLRCVYESELIADCIGVGVSAILVVDHKGKLLGVSHKHDLLASVAV